MAKVNDVQLMICIQTRALDTLDGEPARVRGTKCYLSLRTADASTSQAKNGAGILKI